MQHYWAIAERDIQIQNPVTDRKLRLLDDYCDIRNGLRILDVGCGKAWLLRRWAEQYAIEGTGLDVNPAFIRFARENGSKGSAGTLNFVEGLALNYDPPLQSFDIVMCLGATFALGGFVDALEWMAAATRPGGTMVVGDITLRHRPLVQEGKLPYDPVEAMAVIERHEGEVSATISASEADFERYASHHRHSTLVWAREHPGDPQTASVLKKSREDWQYYQRTIRPLYGFTIFVARRSGA